VRTGETLTAGAQMQKLVDMAQRALEVDRKAADAARHDNPKTLSASLDVTESEICAHFIALARERRESCATRLARLQLDRKATAAKIDVQQTRDAFARLLTPVDPSLEKLRSEHTAALSQAKESEARAVKHLRWFQQQHALHHRAASYPTSPLYHFAIVAALALVEWVSLAAFYAEGSDFGLLGGVLIAMTLSVVNISLAILAGSLLRYVNHRSGRRIALALTGVVVLYAGFLSVTLAAAHYRVATGDIAQSPPAIAAPAGAALPPQVAADFDQWRAARLAWQRFARNPVGFDDVFSWILVVLAVVFGIFASYKGYRIDDPYPGYGQLDRELNARRALYEARKAEYCGLIDGVFDRILDQQARLLTEVKAQIEHYQELVSKSDDERRAFVHDVAEMQDACNILLKRYRQTNARARTSPAPYYFENSFAFDADVVRPPEAISEDEQRLSGSYESAMKDFSDIARQNDATVQSLRTGEIRRREFFFTKLERDVRERLVREAWEIKS
jgi:hypothetical protein